jgi:hypothetical protein
LVTQPIDAVVVALLALVIVAGAVMLVANRKPGKERVVRVAFFVIVAVVFVFIGIEAGVFSSLL